MRSIIHITTPRLWPFQLVKSMPIMLSGDDDYHMHGRPSATCESTELGLQLQGYKCTRHLPKFGHGNY